MTGGCLASEVLACIYTPSGNTSEQQCFKATLSKRPITQSACA